MADVQALKAAIDTLSPNELNEIYNYLIQRRQPSYWLVPSENLTHILDIMRSAQQEAANLTEQETKRQSAEADRLKSGY